jgi:hypothetical protein
VAAVAPVTRESVGVAFVGAGNYAKSVLLPALAARAEARRVQLVTASGPSARRSAEKFGFALCGTDPESAFTSAEVDLVVIATHDSHSRSPPELRAGKRSGSSWSASRTRSRCWQPPQTGGFLVVATTAAFPHARAVRAASSFAARRAIHYSVAAPPRGSWILTRGRGG